MLCDVRKPLRIRLSWKKMTLASLMAEEESVAIPQLLKLPCDDAGKEGSHLFKEMKLTRY